MSETGAAGKASELPASYREAAREIDQIVAKIEGRQDLDVDELASDVERAGALIEFCRSRLEKAELRVQEVQRSLAPESESDRRPDSSDDAG